MYSLKSLHIVNLISFKDQTFSFRNSKAILIVGQNLDDSSQNGNGSGKSSLIEAVALAFTGSSLRDVKTKELIHNNQESAEVTLTLHNKVTGAELIIWRKIYSNTKSAEYKAWVNGEEQSKRYSDLNSFNAFIWDQIGISKEDFFSFFLITKENYDPFLLVGDTKKKEIINRFSGADKVDNAFPFIEDDSDYLAKEIAELEKEVIQVQTRQRVIAEQITEEENRNGEEAKTKLIEAKKSELDRLINEGVHYPAGIEVETELLVEAQTKVTEFETNKTELLLPYAESVDLALQEQQYFLREREGKLKPFQEDVRKAELAVSDFTFSKDYDTEFSAIVSKKTALKSRISTKTLSLPKVKDQFTDEILAIGVEEQELKATLTEAEEILRENEAFESQITKSLHDAIECPKCSHKFSLREKTFNYKEAVEKLPEVQATIAELLMIVSDTKVELNTGIQAKKQAVNQKVLAAQEEIKTEISALNNALVALGEEETALNAEKQAELKVKQTLEDIVTEKKRELQGAKNNLDFQYKTLELSVMKAEQAYKAKENELATALASLQNAVKRAEMKLKQVEQEYAANQDMIESLNKTILRLQTQEVDRSKITELEAKITLLVQQEEILLKQVEKKREEKQAVDAWEIHFRGFKSHLANKCIGNIQQFVNLFLKNMGSNMGIEIDGYHQLSNKKIKEQITTTVTKDGFDAGSYGKFSAGEKARIDVAAILSLQELILLNAGHGYGIDMLFIDEIMESVDVTGMECIINSLQPLQKTIMMVSQHTEINSLANETLIVQKKNKVSQILNQN